MSHPFIAVPLPSKDCAIWPTVRGYLTRYACQEGKGLSGTTALGNKSPLGNIKCGYS